MENFSTSHDLGGEPIRAVQGASCTEGAMLDGLDTAGEWTEYALSVGPFGSWSVAMRVRGDEGVAYAFDVSFTGSQSGATQSVRVDFSGQAYG